MKRKTIVFFLLFVLATVLFSEGSFAADGPVTFEASVNQPCSGLFSTDDLIVVGTVRAKRKALSRAAQYMESFPFVGKYGLGKSDLPPLAMGLAKTKTVSVENSADADAAVIRVTAVAVLGGPLSEEEVERFLRFGDLLRSYMKLWDAQGDTLSSLKDIENLCAKPAGERPGDLAALQERFHKIANRIAAMDWYEKALGLRSGGRFTKATCGKAFGCLEKAVALDPGYAPAYLLSGAVYMDIGDYGNAYVYYKKALGVLGKTSGADDSDLATVYNSLSRACAERGDYNSAVLYGSKALELCLQKSGDDSLDAAAAYDSLGRAYGCGGDHNKALEYYGRALAIRLKALGPQNLMIADSYNNIGSAWGALGDQKKAIGFYEKALAIRLALLGDEHPDVGRSYGNIGGAYYSLGDCDKAVEYMQKALAIMKKTLGPDHPSVAATYNNMGMAYYYYKGDYDKALENYEKALETGTKALGPDHPSVAFIYYSMGLVYEDSFEYDRAREYYAKALDIYSATLGENHPKTRKVRARLLQLPDGR